MRPVWYLWEESAFWWLTGPWARLADILEEDPRVALVVDHCDVVTGEVKGVTALGEAEIVPFDPARAKRKLARYLGPREELWDPRFRSSWDMAARTGSDDDPSGLGRLVPRTLVAGDSSFRVTSSPS